MHSKTHWAGFVFLTWYLVSSAAAQPATPRIPPLDEQIRQLRESGQPFDPAGLKTWPSIPAESNAAGIVIGLKERMRRATREGGLWAEPLESRSIHDIRLPLSPEVRPLVQEALSTQQDVLELYDRITECDGFDWGDPPPSPLATAHTDPPFGAFWGAKAHQLYLDALLAVETGHMRRAWRRVEVLRRLGEGMSTYPGDRNMAPLWPHLHKLAATLACQVAAAPTGGREIEDRPLLTELVGYWTDDRPLREAFVHHYQVERVAIIDAIKHLESGTLDLESIGKSGYRVADYSQMRIGTPMWPTAVALHTEMIDAVGQLPTLLWRDSSDLIRRRLIAFSGAGFVAAHVGNNLGIEFEQRYTQLLEIRSVQKLAAVAVALRLYRLGHNDTLPRTLDELVPAYLSAVPEDPLAEGMAAVRYRNEVGDPLIWFVGRDHRDGNGKEPSKDAQRASRTDDSDDVVHLRLPAITTRDSTP